MARKTTKTALSIDIRDERLEGGRLKISSRTTSKVEHRRREAAVRSLIDRGELAILESLRKRRVRIEDVQRAVEAGDLSTLRPTRPEAYLLGPWVERVIRRAPDASLPNYTALLGALVRDMGEGFPMGRLTNDEAEEWLRKPRATTDGKPWSPGRRKLARTYAKRVWAVAIRAAAEVAHQTGTRPALSLNPWTASNDDRRTKEMIRSRVAWMRPHQWAQLLRHVEGTSRAAFYALGCLAGLRMREALYLRTEIDVDFKNNRVRVQPREGAHPWKPKTERSVRDVPMCAALRTILEAHVANGYAGDTYFFRTLAADAPYTRNAAHRWVAADFPAAGLLWGRQGEGLTYHSLRHTFASWLVQGDAQLLKVARLLGDSVQMVEQVYGHLMSEDLERVTLMLDDKLKGGAQ